MSFVTEIRALEAFEALPLARRSLVLYSEGPEYWPHYRGIIRELLHEHQCPLVYVSSSAADPGLNLCHPLALTFNIGEGGVRAKFFENLEAGVMVLTMPDLDQLALKKSPDCQEYVYLFHSPVSTHMIYRDGAFDHYDTVFCAGPHHEIEIRKRESMLGLKPKRQFAHGYGRLDHIAEGVSFDATPRSGPPQVLVAPSWGPGGLFETVGAEVVRRLLDAGFKVVARPHPQTLKLSKDCIAALVATFGDHENFTLETNMTDKRSFLESDVMVSDWSGAALDFAFARLRPVAFIDTPRKVNNPKYSEMGIEPMEATIRTRIGTVISPDALDGLQEAVHRLIKTAGDYRTTIEASRGEYIHNFGSSDQTAATELVRMTFNHSMGGEVPNEDPIAQLRALIRTDLEGTPEVESSGDSVALIPLLRTLSAAAPLSADQHAQINALCRRIDVFKSLHVEYDPALLKPAHGAVPAALAAYPALSLLLLDASRQTPDGDVGRTFKYLNSAGNALDAWLTRGGARGASILQSLVARAHGTAEAA